MDAALEAYIRRREALIADVRDILHSELHVSYEVEAIDLDAALFGSGLGLDSIDALELVLAAENRFQITLPDSVLREALRTVNSLVDVVLARQGSHAA